MAGLFDLDDVSDVEEVLSIPRGKKDVFGEKLQELFMLAKHEGLNELNISQIAVGYHRRYVLNGNGSKKTTLQITNKLLAMANDKRYHIKKVPGKRGTYYFDDDSWMPKPK